MGKIKFLLPLLACLVACEKDPQPYEFEMGDVPVNTIVIAGRSYTLADAYYYSGPYPAVGKDCVVLHLQFSDGAGVTVELEQRLAGRTISLSPGGGFWFVGVGNGQRGTNHVWVALQNDDGADDYPGHMRMECDPQTDECRLLLDIGRGADAGWIKANIEGRFARRESL